MRRSQPDHMVLGDGEGSLNEESPVRRFPRVGAQFQTRISKSTGPSIRPTPDRMSVDFPYISEKEAEQQNHFCVNGRSNESNRLPFAVYLCFSSSGGAELVLCRHLFCLIRHLGDSHTSTRVSDERSRALKVHYIPSHRLAIQQGYCFKFSVGTILSASSLLYCHPPTRSSRSCILTI